MPKISEHQIGDLDLRVMTFEHAKDLLPMHVHDRNTIHITIVARGSVKIHGPTIESIVYKAGAVIDFEEGHPHEVIAEEDNSRIINITKWIKNETNI